MFNGIGITVYSSQEGAAGASSAPTVSSVVALTQTTIQVTFNKSVSGTVNLGWTWSGTTPVTVASTTALPATSITFTINETLYNDSNVLLSYSSVTGDIAATVGSIDLASFSNSGVTVSGLPDSTPVLDLYIPFTSDLTTTTGTASASLTRALSATGKTAAGLVYTVAANVERTWGTDGMLVEELRENLALQSNTMAVTWVPTGGTVVAAAGTAPDGTNSMARFDHDTNTNSHRFRQAIATASGSDYVVSCFLENDGVRYGGISLKKADSEFISILADLQTGTIATTAVGSTSGTITATGIEDWGGGIYRVWMVGTPGASTAQLYVYTADSASPIFNTSGTVSYTGVAGNDLLSWGAHCAESADYIASLIPTTTVAVTRNADVLSIDETLPSVNDVAWVIDWTPLQDTGATDYIWSSVSDANNGVYLLYDGTDVICRKRLAGANNDATLTLNAVAGTTYRVLGRFDASAGVDVFVDGVKGTNDATTTNATLGTTVQLGADGVGSGQTALVVKEYDVYDQALTDAQAIAAS